MANKMMMMMIPLFVLSPLLIWQLIVICLCVCLYIVSCMSCSPWSVLGMVIVVRMQHDMRRRF